MSVLSRKRSVSELEFYKNGKEIRAEFSRYLQSNRIPKRGLYIYVIPGIKLARKMMEEITAANTIYPTSEAELEQRRFHQTKAIIKCEQIIQHIQWMVDEIDTVKLSDFEILGEKIIKEAALLRAWRKANKVNAPERE